MLLCYNRSNHHTSFKPANHLDHDTLEKLGIDRNKVVHMEPYGDYVTGNVPSISLAPDSQDNKDSPSMITF